jgi:hypothetical protein
MAVDMLEDDVFFAELSKQISLLITDDDDADVAAAAQFIPDVAAPLPVSHRPLAPRSVPSGHRQPSITARARTCGRSHLTGQASYPSVGMGEELVPPRQLLGPGC